MGLRLLTNVDAQFWQGKQALAVLVLIAASLFSPVSAQEDRAGVEFFETKIRPILVRECYSCHSESAAKDGKLRGGLLLDSREGSHRGGDSGPAVVPRQIESSSLIAALRHETFEMPPKGKLSDEVINDFVKWIEMGAPDPREGKAAVGSRSIDIQTGKEFWSFQVLRQDPSPAVDETHASAIDRFVGQKQTERGIVANRSATARLLVRRAWIDLLGLPPTPEEMAYWVARLKPSSVDVSQRQADGEPVDQKAWAELIDHLLASPHYGERWARHWIDVARFAESHGYEQDYDRPTAYHYRDFLIRAFNDDLPYDQFVRWQLAGDELQPDNPLAWMATGFLGGGPFPTQLTENEFESARYDELDDMVATTGVAFLGLSIGCARCHDHKFDPIPAADYYRFAANFTKAIRTEKEFDLNPEENRRRQLEYDQELQRLQQNLAAIEREQLPTAFLAYLGTTDDGSRTSPWKVIDGEVQSSAKTKFQRLADGSFLATGNSPPKETISLRLPKGLGSIRAIRLEALADESLPKNGPGRSDNGNFVLGEVTLMSGEADEKHSKDGKPQVIKLAKAEATFQQNTKEFSVAAAIDGKANTGWALDGAIGTDQAAVFWLAEPSSPIEAHELTLQLSFNHSNKKQTIGRLRLSISVDEHPSITVGDCQPSERVKQALAALRRAPIAKEKTEQSAWLGDRQDDWQIALDWFKTTFEPWKSTAQSLRKHEATGPRISLSKALVTSEGLPHLPHHADARGFPHFYPVTHQLRRGDVSQKVAVAEPGFLQVLLRDEWDSAAWNRNDSIGDRSSPVVSHPRSRLASWITDPQKGAGSLAARVIVNRLWQHHFGSGLVTTPNDFGTSGERPTHPELLEWLANRLIDEGWRLKPMHKLMMTSSVYQLSCDMAFEKGSPADPRYTADPDNRWLWRRVPQRMEAEAIRDAMMVVAGNLDTTMYGPGTLDQQMKRRSVYFFIKRSNLIPMMMLFDWPEHLVSIGQRASTTIAPQALMFLNSLEGRSYAEGFAMRIVGEKPDHQIQRAYQLAFGRDPDRHELRSGRDFIERQRTVRSQEPKAERDRLAIVDFCQILLSTNEFIYVE